MVPAEEEALQRAVVEVLSEIPNNAYDLKPRPEATGLEAACYEQAVSLARAIPGLGLNMATPSGLLGLITNQVRLEAVRDLAAIHGRSAASGAGGSGGQGTASASVGGRIPGVLGNAGSPAGMAPPPLPPGALLTPYEVACNEAAAYLASGMPALLTHRRDLADLAKKAVRLCGCIFSHTPTTLMDKIGGGYRFYCSDQMSELDLSAAERLLTNSLEENDEIVEALSALGLHSITSGSLSPAISESSTDTVQYGFARSDGVFSNIMNPK
ncbi:unnamed protein product [Protopolystoma xenopodis]|uniref:NAB co-repressor domain-containing protein n=1 Tax=Protopolystoma xenopodis TaxID=117903 RepID=A0A448WK32_9PLAT|nr:unnamed protein product [Protopolystoma xenopodis]